MFNDDGVGQAMASSFIERKIKELDKRLETVELHSAYALKRLDNLNTLLCANAVEDNDGLLKVISAAIYFAGDQASAEEMAESIMKAVDGTIKKEADRCVGIAQLVKRSIKSYDNASQAIDHIIKMIDDRNFALRWPQ